LTGLEKNPLASATARDGNPKPKDLEPKKSGKKNALALKSANATPRTTAPPLPKRNRALVGSAATDQENIVQAQPKAARGEVRQHLFRISKSSRPVVVPQGDEDAVVNAAGRNLAATTSPTAAWIKHKASGVVSGAKRAAGALLLSPSRKHGKKYRHLEEAAEEEDPEPSGLTDVQKSKDRSEESIVLEDYFDELSLPNGAYSVRYEDGKTVAERVPCAITSKNRLATTPTPREAITTIMEVDEEVMTDSPLAQNTPASRWLRRKKKFQFLKESQRHEDTVDNEKQNGTDYSLPGTDCEMGHRSKRYSKMVPLKKKKANLDLRGATGKKGSVGGNKAVNTPGKVIKPDLGRKEDSVIESTDEDEEEVDVVG
jgi:hypothetical protein